MKFHERENSSQEILDRKLTKAIHLQRPSMKIDQTGITLTENIMHVPIPFQKEMSFDTRMERHKFNVLRFLFLKMQMHMLSVF